MTGSRYRVLNRLASGGMADVYLAVLQGAHGFEKQTIVKRMRADLADDEDFRRMFIDEARLMASLSHSNIVSVLDFGEGEEGIFIALEHVDGLDLARLLKRTGPLDPKLAVYVGSCVLHALAYVHGHAARDGTPLHVVHRDVSPSNVFLGRNGDVKLGDFGVAKMSRASVRTMPGTIKGKLAYMSPEQAAALEVDARSDLFSMGVVLFEVLTGKRPFSAPSDVDLLRKLIEDEAPDPRSVAPELSPKLAAFLSRALARDRTARFQAAEEMSRALLACADGPPLGPADVARLVVASMRPEDSAPAADPFAVALGLEAGAQSTTDQILAAKTRTEPPGRPDTQSLRRLAGLGRGPGAAISAALVVVALGGAGWWVLEAGGAGAPTPAVEPRVAVPPPAAEAASDAGPAIAAVQPAVEPRKDPEPVAHPAKRPPAPAHAKAGKATLIVNSTPWGKVFLDGAPVGDTPAELAVEVGKHRLKLVNPAAGKSFETTVELGAGERRVVPVDLEAGVITGP